MIKIVYEDKNVLVIQKPCDVVVHPDSHHSQNTILDLVKTKLDFKSFVKNEGIVHRLDKVVSGLMLIARHARAWNYFKKALQKHNIVRKYLALVEGKVEWEQLKVDVPLLKPGKNPQAKVAITGKKAVTYLKVIKKWSTKTLLECTLESGRTHQIRAHLKYIGHPIINDPLYNQGKDSCIFLYSYFLAFIDPETGRKREFKEDTPQFFPVDN